MATLSYHPPVLPSRRSCLASAVLALLSSCHQPPHSTQEGASKPNIVFIMADDLGYECLECDGGLDYRTPHLDALAAGGMRFEHAHSNPVCTPTRVQVMTGRYTQRNYECFGYLPPSELTFANLLRDAGYATCIAGKWQLSGDADTVHDFGFDSHCLWNMNAYRVDDTGRAAGQPEESWMRRYSGPTLYQDGKWVEYGGGSYGPQVCLDFILEFIERERESPFFVYYPMILTHDPFVPTPDSADPDSKDRKANFVDMVQYTDRIVGELVAALEAQDLRDKTLVIFTGDNGTHTTIGSNTRGGLVQGAKASSVDAGTHVPLIANWPGRIDAGQVSSALVDFTDFLPTLAEVAGAELPRDRVFDGFSLVPHLTGAAPHRREWIYCYYPHRGRNFEKVRVFARDRRWKLYDDGELFDVVADPLEQTPSPGTETADALDARERLGRAIEAVGQR